MPNEPGRKPVLHTKKHVARLERERQQTRLVLYIFIGILAAVLLLVGYGFLDVNYLQLNKPVAKVGEVEISARDFEARVRLQRQQLLNNYNMNLQYYQVFGIDTTQQLQQIEYYLNTADVLGQSVIDQMVNEELIRQEAAKRGITVSAAELDEFIQAGFEYFPNGTHTPTVTPTQVVLPEPPAEAFAVVTITAVASATSQTTFTPTLPPTSESAAGIPASTSTLEPAATPTVTFAPTATATTGPTATASPTATPYTLEGFQSEYDNALKEFMKLGLAEEDYRKLMEMQTLQDKLMDVIAGEITPMEEQVWARHILVSDSAQALAIIERLKAGEDFGQLAGEFSEDTGSAVAGGDLGWFGKGAMVAEFETAVFALQKSGDFTLEPVQSQFGYHIIQLIAKQDRPLTASQYEQARSTAFSEWLTAVREEYVVETFDDFWKSRVPTEPNFSTMATEAVNAANTQSAEAPAEAAATPE